MVTYYILYYLAGLASCFGIQIFFHKEVQVSDFLICMLLAVIWPLAFLILAISSVTPSNIWHKVLWSKKNNENNNC